MYCYFTENTYIDFRKAYFLNLLLRSIEHTDVNVANSGRAVLQWVINQSSHQRCSLRKGVLRNFAKFTGKHLCQSLFFNSKQLQLELNVHANLYRS